MYMHTTMKNYQFLLCLLEMMLVVHVEFFTLITKLNWQTETNAMVIVLQRIQTISFSH